MTIGSVLGLWRYPVKSMGGEPVRSLRLDWRGVGGDRTHAVLFDAKTGRRPLTAREAAGLLAFRASYPFAPDAGLDPAHPPPAQVTTPEGEHLNWPDSRLRRRVEEHVGRPVVLHRDERGIQDLGQSVLVTTEASRRALQAELGGRPVDLRRFRPNVHLSVVGPPWIEHGWEGATMTFSGGVVLELLHPCVRCAIPNRDPDTQERWPGLLRHLAARHGTLFGINARVAVPGRIATSQGVEIR